MATAKITTTLRLEEPLYKDLHNIASTEVRSLNNLIEYALTKFVQHYQPREEFPQEQHSETGP